MTYALKEGNFSADGNSTEIPVQNNDGVHIALKNDFGSGTVTIQEKVNGNWYSAMDASGNALTYTAAVDVDIAFKVGDIIRLNLNGSTSPDLDYKVR